MEKGPTAARRPAGAWNSANVREVPAQLLKKLELGAEAEAEAASWRDLLPPDPWVDALKADPGHFTH